jgi:hypothetical protein
MRPAIKICAPTNDYDKISRPKESFYDVGPYEFSANSSSIVPVQMLPCDLNGDGSTDALDIQLLANAISSDCGPTIYDLNKDGQVNELDRHVLENVLLGRATCP